MSEAVVEFAAHEGVATITLNRPDSLNAMNSELMMGISESMSRVEEDKTVRVVVITGAGRGFCAGADLSGTVGTEEPGNQAMGDVFNPALRAIHNSPVPTVARVNGAAAGGGMGLALACDIVIAAKSAFFVATFGPRRGIVPDLGSTWTMPRSLGRARALAAAMLGDRIPSETAELWGLIWKSVPDDKLDSEIDEVTARLKVTSAEAMVRIRQSIDAASTNTFSEQLDLEMHHQGVLIPKNMQEGAAAFIEKREPLFTPRS
jgi:2-(1,2-epoxy-1,2-dihydrophenyl)acetyl-CoA isomerase